MKAKEQKEAVKILKYMNSLENTSPQEITDDSFNDLKEKKGTQFIFEEKGIYIIVLGKLEVRRIMEILYDKDKIDEEYLDRSSGYFNLAVLQVEKNENGIRYVEESISCSPFLFHISKLLKANNSEQNLENDEIKDFDVAINKVITEELDKEFQTISREIIENNQEIKEEILNKIEEKLIECISIIIKKLNFTIEYINELKNEEKKLKIKRLNENSKKEYGFLGSFYSEDLSVTIKYLKEKNDRKLIKYLTDITKNTAELSDEDELNEEVLGKKVKKMGKILSDRDTDFLKEMTSPKKFPLGRWPNKYYPSLMQQIAINLAKEKTGEKEILAVNGPPGTGKTTLLKDIIADRIVTRAEKIIESKYRFQKEELKTDDQYSKSSYTIPEFIGDGLILVASNNNSAVENISNELPLAKDMLEEETLTDLFDVNKNEEIYYTKEINDFLGKDSSENWGLISLALGKKSNIEKFNNKTRINLSFKESIFHEIATDSKNNEEKYKKLYEEAAQEFSKQRNKVIEIINLMERDKEILEKHEKFSIEDLNSKKVELEENIENKKNNNAKEIEKLERIEKEIDFKLEIIKNKINELMPKGFFSFIFKFTKENDETIKVLKREKEELMYKRIENSKSIRSLKESKSELEKNISKLKDEIKEMEQIENISKKYTQIQKHSGEDIKVFPRKDFWENVIENEYTQYSCPWRTEELDREREILFKYALDVQKYFVWSNKDIKQNINNLLRYWKIFSTYPSKEDRIKVMTRGLQCLSLITPVISTTFASLGTFLKETENEFIGLLIVDEAGQATPASSIGAVRRAKDVIIVGDPLQVEPISTVPLPLVEAFADKYELERNSPFRSPVLSVQNLADATSNYVGILNNQIVGSPLVVHRRCVSPMFDISNEISYQNRMFNATVNKEKEFKLPDSRWIDVLDGQEHGGKDHFVPKEGKVVRELLEKYDNEFFKKENALFIITPFTSVSNEIRKEVKSFFKEREIEDKAICENWILKNIGTVHTFQGKGADEVIFVTGCDERSLGAVRWASSKANILNVAVSRAKFRFVIVGNKKIWGEVPNFTVAKELLKS